MVSQRIFNTRLLIYLLIFPFFGYLSTSGLRTSGLIIYLPTFYLLTYLLISGLLIYLLTSGLFTYLF